MPYACYLGQRAASTHRRTERLEARIPADLKEQFVRAADLQGQTLTDFVVSTVTEAARRVIREQEVLQLSRRDQEEFARQLLEPPRANAKLRAAARAYRRQIRG